MLLYDEKESQYIKLHKTKVAPVKKKLKVLGKTFLSIGFDRLTTQQGNEIRETLYPLNHLNVWF